MKYTIYKTTNTVNGKSYIGFDSNWPRRKTYHLRTALNKPRLAVHYAIQKYGIDSFEWEVLYRSNDYEFTLTIMESYFIRQYDSFINGYNNTPGGEGCRSHSAETKMKMSKANKGKTISPEMRQILSEKIKGRHFHTEESKRRIGEAAKGRSPWQKGTVGLYTDAHKEKLSIAAKRRKGEKRKVTHPKYNYLITHPDGREEIVSDLPAFCKAHGIKKGLYSVASGKRKHHKGYKARKL